MLISIWVITKNSITTPIDGAYYAYLEKYVRCATYSQIAIAKIGDTALKILEQTDIIYQF
jgi:hypothetical protein